MSAGSRLVRVNELLKRELGRLITTGNIAPSASVLVSVTEVRTSSDLRHATVFVSVFGGDDETVRQVLRTLRNRRSEFQHDISQVVSLKYTPVLKFELDLRIAAGDRVYELLENDLNSED
ncbi:MAG: 30S ribosome-binding factor RbfA [Victivallaceae bacterium]|nr:30S ribosome-binding factor RbfA [Victivallaceae bacterium]